MIFYLTWISLVAGGILVVMLLLSLLGGIDLDVDADFSMESDTDAGGLGILKGALTFVSVSCWVMKMFLMFEQTKGLALLFGLLAGFLAMFLLNLMVKALLNNDENVNWSADDALFQQGVVYLKIPAEIGTGIVNININGATREMKAKSHENKEIKTGAKVRVVEVQGEFAVVKEENI